MAAARGTASTPPQPRAVRMVDRIHIVKSWRQIAAEVAQEDDPEKLRELTEELHRALQRELHARVSSENIRAKTA